MNEALIIQIGLTLTACCYIAWQHDKLKQADRTIVGVALGKIELKVEDNNITVKEKK